MWEIDKADGSMAVQVKALCLNVATTALVVWLALDLPARILFG